MATIIKMPALSDTMTEGTIAVWHKKVGDSVKNGELLAEIETDKATMDFESFFDGVLLHIGVETGGTIPVNALLAVIGKQGEDWQSAMAADNGAAPAAESPKKEESSEAAKSADGSSSLPKANTPNDAQPATENEQHRLKASPLAKSIAKEHNIPLAQLKGSGDEGRIVKRDVEAFLQTKPEEPPTPMPSATAVAEMGSYTDTTASQMRKTIARRLSESKNNAPHFYLTITVNMDKAKDLRVQMNAVSPVKISFNDFVIKATALALLKHPKVNASWLGDKIRTYHYVNMGVAVAVEEGLLVPVVRNANAKSLSNIAEEVNLLAGKAKERKLQPEDMQGNTFTISNLGMFGIDEFTAIINSPDACILAVGKIAENVVVKDGGFAIANQMKLTLSCDHRVVDGAMGAQFLQTLKQYLEEPMLMLV